MRFVVGIVILAAVSGCLQYSGADCEGAIPPFHGGDRALYTGDGSPFFATSDAIGTWPADHPKGDGHRGGIGVGPGDALVVAIAKAPVPDLDYRGRLLESFQVTSWFWDDGYWLDFRDEWVGPAGNAVREESRHMLPYGNETEHAGEWYAGQAPAIVLASLVAGGRPPAGLDVSYPSSISGPLSDNSTATFEAKQLADCDWIVSVSFTLRNYPSIHGDLVFDADAPFPKQVDLRQGTSHQFRATMVEFARGDGPVVVTDQEVPIRDSYAKVTPDFFEWIAAISRGFPTTLSEAVNWAKTDSAVSSWLGQHPDAVLASVEHHGSVSPKFRDGWRLGWMDGEQTLDVMVRNRTPGLPVVEPGGLETQVLQGDRQMGYPLTAAPEWIAPAWVQDVWSARSGDLSLEAIRCGAPPNGELTCGLGTTASMKNGLGESGFPPTGREIQGFVLHPAGYVVLDSSVGSEWRPAPVPHGTWSWSP